MLIVAGLSLKNLEPRVWDPKSRFYLSSLPAVMVSYGEFHQMQSRRRTAMDLGLRAYLGVPREVKVYLDNGAFYFASQAGEAPLEDYERFSEEAKPDWKPIPQDYIPLPGMTPEIRKACFDRTMRINLQYQKNGYVPVVHIGEHLREYTAAVRDDPSLSKKPRIA